MEVSRKPSAKQMKVSVASWGGRRKGAGRKNRSRTVNHMKREKVGPQWPLHITLRLAPGRPSLRRQSLLEVFAIAVAEAKKFGLRINQFSFLGNHFHLIAEADNNRALRQGMQCLTIRIAKHLKKFGFLKPGSPEPLATKPKNLFLGRYHLQVLKTPLAVKNALRYVLVNEAKHAGRMKSQAPGKDLLSIYSSGFCFKNWRQLGWSVRQDETLKYAARWQSIAPLANWLAPPKSWLGREGWQGQTKAKRNQALDSVETIVSL